MRTELELIPDSLVFMVTEVDVSVGYSLELGVLYIFILILQTISHLINHAISTFLAFKLPAEFVESVLVDWRQLLLVVLRWCLLLVGDLCLLTRVRHLLIRLVLLLLLLLLLLLTSIGLCLPGYVSIHFLQVYVHVDDGYDWLPLLDYPRLLGLSTFDHDGCVPMSASYKDRRLR